MKLRESWYAVLLLTASQRNHMKKIWNINAEFWDWDRRLKLTTEIVVINQWQNSEIWGKYWRNSHCWLAAWKCRVGGWIREFKRCQQWKNVKNKKITNFLLNMNKEKFYFFLFETLNFKNCLMMWKFKNKIFLRKFSSCSLVLAIINIETLMFFLQNNLSSILERVF